MEEMGRARSEAGIDPDRIDPPGARSTGRVESAEDRVKRNRSYPG